MKLTTKIALGLVSAVGLVAIALASLALTSNSTPPRLPQAHSGGSAQLHPTTVGKIPVINLSPTTTTTVAPANVTPPPTTVRVRTVTPATVPLPPAPTTTTTAPKVTAPAGPISVTATTGVRNLTPVTIAATINTALTGSLGDPFSFDCRTDPTSGCFEVTVHVGGVGPVPVGSLNCQIYDNTGALVTSVGNPEPGQDELVGSLPSSVITNGFTYVVTFTDAGYVTTSTGSLKG